MLFPILGNSLSALNNQNSTSQLENGSVIFLPEYYFQFLPEEQILLTDTLLNGKSKNISYDASKQSLSGIDANHPHYALAEKMMARYVDYSQQLVAHLFPHYQSTLQTARTSFRPAEIAGRIPDSYRKDDTRLHIDAFPATPNQGMRLLRVFCNVNPQKPRVWRLGEPFADVVNYFAKQLKIPFAAKKYILKTLGITKTLRTDYDALMLQLHDKMKADMTYQKNCQQQQVELPGHSSWIVFTDQVSHAALSGQFCLEQTFLLPVDGMAEPETSPLKILENQFKRKLV